MHALEESMWCFFTISLKYVVHVQDCGIIILQLRSAALSPIRVMP